MKSLIIGTLILIILTEAYAKNLCSISLVLCYIRILNLTSYSMLKNACVSLNERKYVKIL